MRLRTICEAIDATAIIQMLPTSHQAAFKKAYAWKPRLSLQSADARTNLAHIVAGRKPAMIVTKPKQETIRLLVEKGLMVQPSVGDTIIATTYDNEDIADLINYVYAKWSINTPELHYVVGICMGYPIEEVERFTEKYYGDLDLRRPDIDPFGG